MKDKQTRQELPPDLRQEIDSFLRQAGEAQRGNDPERSEKLRLQAWAMLPEPKTRVELLFEHHAQGQFSILS